MPAPKRPNTAAATAAVVRRGQETMARKLKAGGWFVVAPEERLGYCSCCDRLHDICGMHPQAASS